MENEKTLCILKPDIIGDNNAVRTILDMFSKHKLSIVKVVSIRPTKKVWDIFYEDNREKSTHERNISFLASGPSMAVVLQGENAIEKCRELVGATDPEEAEEGTIRKMFGTTLPMNAVHASDSQHSFETEMSALSLDSLLRENKKREKVLEKDLGVAKIILSERKKERRRMRKRNQKQPRNQRKS